MPRLLWLEQFRGVRCFYIDIIVAKKCMVRIWWQRWIGGMRSIDIAIPIAHFILWVHVQLIVTSWGSVCLYDGMLDGLFWTVCMMHNCKKTIKETATQGHRKIIIQVFMFITRILKKKYFPWIKLFKFQKILHTLQHICFLPCTLSLGCENIIHKVMTRNCFLLVYIISISSVARQKDLSELLLILQETEKTA